MATTSCLKRGRPGLDPEAPKRYRNTSAGSLDFACMPSAQSMPAAGPPLVDTHLPDVLPLRLEPLDAEPQPWGTAPPAHNLQLLASKPTGPATPIKTSGSDLACLIAHTQALMARQGSCASTALPAVGVGSRPDVGAVTAAAEELRPAGACTAAAAVTATAGPKIAAGRMAAVNTAACNHNTAAGAMADTTAALATSFERLQRLLQQLRNYYQCESRALMQCCKFAYACCKSGQLQLPSATQQRIKSVLEGCNEQHAEVLQCWQQLMTQPAADASLVSCMPLSQSKQQQQYHQQQPHGQQGSRPWAGPGGHWPAPAWTGTDDPAAATTGSAAALFTTQARVLAAAGTFEEGSACSGASPTAVAAAGSGNHVAGCGLLGSLADKVQQLAVEPLESAPQLLRSYQQCLKVLQRMYDCHAMELTAVKHVFRTLLHVLCRNQRQQQQQHAQHSGSTSPGMLPQHSSMHKPPRAAAAAGGDFTELTQARIGSMAMLPPLAPTAANRSLMAGAAIPAGSSSSRHVVAAAVGAGRHPERMPAAAAVADGEKEEEEDTGREDRSTGCMQVLREQPELLTAVRQVQLQGKLVHTTWEAVLTVAQDVVQQFVSVERAAELAGARQQ